MLAVPLALLMAFGIANVQALTTGWKASSTVPITAPAEKCKAIFAAIRGRSDAQADIRNGHLTLKTWGLPALNYYTYAEVTEKRLGVKLDTVAGCVVSSSQMAGWNAYNEVIDAEIARRFGPHAMEAVETEVRALSIARDSGQAWYEAYTFAGSGARDCGVAHDAASETRVYDCGQRTLAAKQSFYCRFEKWIDRDPFNGPTAVYTFNGHTLVVIPNGTGQPAAPVHAKPVLRGMRTEGRSTVLFGMTLPR